MSRFETLHLQPKKIGIENKDAFFHRNFDSTNLVLLMRVGDLQWGVCGKQQVKGHGNKVHIAHEYIVLRVANDLIEKIGEAQPFRG